jgi:hypothetical protein
MSLIVETGSGSATSESYASVTFFDSHHADRGNTLAATLSTNEKEQALRRATDYMLQVFRSRWKGVRLNAVQALDWPRYGVYLEPVLNGAASEFPNLVASDIVPAEIQKACAEFAFRAAGGPMLDDTTQLAIRKKVEGIEIEYDKYSPQSPQYKAIEALLAPYLSATGGMSHRLVR